MFILVGLGIVGGVGLIVVEILYHKHKVCGHEEVKMDGVHVGLVVLQQEIWTINVEIFIKHKVWECKEGIKIQFKKRF